MRCKIVGHGTGIWADTTMELLLQNSLHIIQNRQKAILKDCLWDHPGTKWGAFIALSFAVCRSGLLWDGEWNINLINKWIISKLLMTTEMELRDNFGAVLNSNEQESLAMLLSLYLSTDQGFCTKITPDVSYLRVLLHRKEQAGQTRLTWYKIILVNEISCSF